MNCELIADLGPAYALDTLERVEREALEAHAVRCPACARELRALREVAGEIAIAVPQQELPPALGVRILESARLDLVSDEQRVADGADFHTRPGPTPRRWPRVVRRLSAAIPMAALAAALIALLWGVNLQNQLGAARNELADTSGQLERLRTNYGTVVQVLASSQTRVRDLQPGESAPTAHGKVWVDQQSGRGMLMAQDLPALADGQAYQVWLANGQSRISSGFLRPYTDGVYYIVLQAPGPVTDYQRVGITREPVGGSPGPTGPRIIGGEL